MGFVSYDNYINRIQKLAKIKNFISRFKFLIIGVLAVLIAGITTLLVMKGMITSALVLPAQITYGESYSPAQATAFLSEVTYEYSVAGSGEWTDEKPVKAGKYLVRTVTQKAIGKGYGDPVEFEILPATITFNFNNSSSSYLYYGSAPSSRDYSLTGLVSSYGDAVKGVEFDYDYPEADDEDFTVGVTLKSINITDAYGTDSSSCYIYETPSTSYNFAAKSVSFKIDNASETYNGNGFTYSGKADALTLNQLVGNDKYSFSTKLTNSIGETVTPVNADTYLIALDGNITVLDENGKDITYRYAIGTPVSGTFTVNQRAVTITTQGGEKVYDGTPLSKEGGSADNLVSGHTLSLIGSAPSVTEVREGSVQNSQSFKIYSGTEDVTRNYQIKYEYNYLKITPRPLTVTTDSGEWEYDGNSHTKENYTLNGLADGQTLKNISYKSVTNVTDSGKNILSFEIYSGSVKIDLSNYSVEGQWGTLTVTARPLKITTQGATQVYNGSPLTNASYTAIYYGSNGAQTEANGLLNGDKLTLTGAYPSITDVGTKENAIPLAAPYGNYSIVATDYGTLEVTKLTISVTLKSYTATYGDSYAYQTGAGNYANVPNLVYGERLEITSVSYEFGTVAYPAVRASAYWIKQNGFKITKSNGADSTGNYNVEWTNGALTVTNRTLTVYLNDVEETYGNKISYKGGNERVINLVAGYVLTVDSSKVTFDITSSMPDASTYYRVISCPVSAIKITDASGNVVTSNFSLSASDIIAGTLKINKRDITVKAKDMLGIIYGEEINYTISEGNYANTPDLVSGEKLTVNNVIYGYNQGVTPTVGKYTITPDLNNITILKADGTSSRANYNITPEDGTLEIVQRPVKILSGTAENLIYNGTAQYFKGYAVTSGEANFYNVLSVHDIEVTKWTTVTDVSEGVVQNKLEYEIVDQSGSYVTANYAISHLYGTLKVNPRKIEVTLDSYSATYGDGYAYATGAGNYANTPNLVSGESLEITSVSYEFGNVTYPDVRSTPYSIKQNGFKITKSDGTDSTGNYEVKWTDGALTVTQREIEVQLLTYSATYGDSYAYQTGAGNYANVPDLVSGEKLEITAVTYEFGTVTYPEVRTAPYVIQQNGYTVTKSNGADSKGNYKVKWTDGALTITARPLTIKTDGGSHEYDGTVYSVENYTATGLAAGHNLANIVYYTATNVDDSGDNSITYEIRSDSGVINRSNYDISEEWGTLTITARPLKVTTEGASRVYNGKPLTNENYTVIYYGEIVAQTEANGLLNGDKLTLTGSYPEITDFGTKQNAIPLEVPNNNYKIVATDYGTLEITKIVIPVIQIKSFSEDYGIYTYANVNSAYPTEAGNYENELDLVEGEELTVSVDFGLTNTSVFYLWADDYTVTGKSFKVTKADGSDSTNNYTVTEYKDGTLTVNKIKITVTTSTKEFNYNGYEQDDRYGYKIEGLAPNDYANPHYTNFTKVKDCTEEPVKNEVELIIWNYSKIVTSNYEIEFNYGTLTVTPRAITVTLNGITSTYGATPEYKTGGEDAQNIVSGHTVSVSATFDDLTVTPIGDVTYPNVGSYGITCENSFVSVFDGEDDVTKNYSITVAQGTLSVTAKEITVTLNDTTATYGDKEIVYNSGNESAEGLLDGHRIEIAPEYASFSPASDKYVYPNAGEYTVTVDQNGNFIKIYNGEEDVTANYTVTEVKNGTLTINARKITVTLADIPDTVYGEEIPDPVISYSDIVNGDELIGTFETADGAALSYLDVGDYQIYLAEGFTFKYANGAPETYENYEIEGEISPCNLKITPRPLTLTFKDFESEYGRLNSYYIDWRIGYPASTGIVNGEIEDYLDIDGLADGESFYRVHWHSLDPETGRLVKAKDVGDYDLMLHVIVIKTFTGSNKIIYISNSQVDSNYAVTVEGEATLTIKPKELTVNLDYSFTYGDEEEGWDGYEYTQTDGLMFNETLTLSEFTLEDVTSYPLNADTYTVNGANVIKVDGSEDGVKNYNLTINGTLTVTPKGITVTLNDTTATYGDENIVYNSGNETAEGLLDGHRIEIAPEYAKFSPASDKYVYPNAGEYTISVDQNGNFIKIYNGEEDVTANYTVTEVKNGTLTINARKITVTLADIPDTVYGEEISDPEISYSDIVNGDYIIGTFETADGAALSYLDVGDYQIYLAEGFTFHYANGAPATYENYEIVGEILPCNLKITPRPLTVTLKDIELDYGGVNSAYIDWLNGNITVLANFVCGELEDYLEIDRLADGESFYNVIWRSPDPETGEYVTMKDAGYYNLKVYGIIIKTISGSSKIIYLSYSQVDSNYAVTVEGEATLTIKPKELTVNLDYSFTYGDEEVGWDGYEYTQTDGLMFNETLTLSEFTLEDVTSPLNKGTYTINGANVIKVDGSADGVKNYNLTINGTLTVKEKQITVTPIAFDGTYYYGDGKTLVYSDEIGNYESAGELAYGQQLKIALAWTLNGKTVAAPKDAGLYDYCMSVENSVLYDKDGNEILNGLDNYSFVLNSRQLTIKPLSIGLNIEDKNSVYGDKLPFMPNAYYECTPPRDDVIKYDETVYARIVYYDYDEFVKGNRVVVTPCEVGKYVIYADKCISYNADGTKQTAENYILSNVTEGCLSITKREITVTTAAMPNFVYGENVSFTVKSGNHGVIGGMGLVDGQELTIISVDYYDENGNLVSGVPTEVGKYYVVPTNVLIFKGENEIDVDRNYDISYPELTDCETFEILPLNIRLVTATRKDFIYDGQEHYDTSFTLWLLDENGNVLHELVLSDEEAASVKTVGEYTKVKEVCTGVDNKVRYDFSATNYNVSEENYVYGKLTVNKRAITVTLNDITSTYGATPVYKNGGEDVGNVVSGHTVTVSATYADLKVTPIGGYIYPRVGDYGITCDKGFISVSDGEKDVTGNYSITVAQGTLTVTPRQIKIVINNYNVDYGVSSPVPANGFTYAEGSDTVISGDELSIAVRYYLKSDESKTLLQSVKGVGVYGVVLYGAGCFVSTSYDSANGFTNYEVDFEEGTVTVQPKEVTVTLKDLTKVYGETFTGYPTASVTEGLEYGEALKVTVGYSAEIGERTDAGSYTIKAVSFTLNGVEYTAEDGATDCGNYLITFVDGTLKITARKITVVTGILTEVYDGKYHYNTEIASSYYYGNKSKAGILEGDEGYFSYIESTVTKIINKGSLKNTTEFICVSNNYDIASYVYGTLIINAKPVTVSLNQIDDVYYGTRLAYPSEVGNYSGEERLVEGEELEIAVKFYDENGNEADPKNAGTYYYEIYLKNCVVYNSIGGSGIANYDITCTDRLSATVRQLAITLTPDLWTAIDYDGQQHSYDGKFNLTSGTDDGLFPYGEELEVSIDYYSVIDGVETLLTNSYPKNAGEYLVKLNLQNTKIGGERPDLNYQLSVDDIFFTINQKQITISMGDETRTYDGTAYDYAKESTKFTVTGVVGGEKIVPVVTYLGLDGAPVNKGEYTVELIDFTVTGGLVSNYKVSDGSDGSCALEITAREIYVYVDFNSIELGNEIKSTFTSYSNGSFGFTEADLKELTPEYTYYFEDAEIAVEDIAKRGSYTVVVSFGENSVLDNYSIISNTAGILEVTARKVTVKPVYTGGELVYNGEQITVSADTFGYQDWHGDDVSELGFAADYSPEYKFLFTNWNGVSSYEAPVDAGTYEVKVEFFGIDEDTYTVNNTQTITITIKPRPVTVTYSGYDASKLDGYLTYSFSELPDDLITVSTDDILDIDSTVEVEWYYYNFNYGEVTYNYAGTYVIYARIGKNNGNYQIVNNYSGVSFTVKPATLYVTPVGKTEDYVGQTLSLTDYKIWEEYGVLYSNGGVTDTLTVKGSNVLSTARMISVTISKVTIMQGSLDVTSSYDVHYKWEEGSPVASEEFTAMLQFNPVKIYYTQAVLDDAHRVFNYDGTAHDLGVDKDNLAAYITIQNAGDFVGVYRLQYVLVPIITVRNYDKWIQIIVWDGNNNNVTSLYDFVLTNAEESRVTVLGDEFKLEGISDGALQAAWDNKDGAGSVLSLSTLYGEYGYYVLDAGCYSYSGLGDGRKCEVLLRQDNGALTVKVIVFEETAYGRTDCAMYYTMYLPDGLTYNVTLSYIGQLFTPVTTNLQAENSASFGGYSL